LDLLFTHKEKKIIKKLMNDNFGNH
jgi:hypothetical protein